MAKKILVLGLPGAGKTTLAKTLAPMLGAVHFNADEVRKNLNKDLGFSLQDRIEQSRRMGFLCDTVVKAGHHAIADFICPFEETRQAFSGDFIIWMDTINRGRYADTNEIWKSPSFYDIRIGEFPNEKMEELCRDIANKINMLSLNPV